MIYRPDVDVADERQRAALVIYSTLLGGSMGSRLFEEIREKRGLCYSVYAINHAFADVPILQLGSGLESSKCIEAYGRMREIVDELRSEGPTERGGRRAPAPTPPGGWCWRSRTPARSPATPPPSRSSSARASTRTRRSPRSTRSPSMRSPKSPQGIGEELAVACVGPHTADEF